MLLFITKYGLNITLSFQSSKVGQSIEIMDLTDKAIQISNIALLSCYHAQMLIIYIHTFLLTYNLQLSFCILKDEILDLMWHSVKNIKINAEVKLYLSCFICNL